MKQQRKVLILIYFSLWECFNFEKNSYYLVYTSLDLELKNNGNFYQTFDEASKVAENIKELFKNSQWHKITNQLYRVYLN